MIMLAYNSFLLTQKKTMNSFEFLPSNAAATQPVAIDQHLGWMLYDVFDLSDESPTMDTAPFISVFDATMRGGVIDVPPFTSAAVRKPGAR